MKMKFTLKTIAAAELPPGKPEDIFWDVDLPGFGVRFRRHGDRLRRTWVAQYRAHGRTRRMRLGAVEKLTLDEARKEVRKVLAKVELGADPQAERRAQRQREGDTLRAVADLYLDAKRSEVRPNTYRELDRYLTGPHFRPLHPVPIDQVARRDVAVRLTKITAENGSITAGRARAALSALYAWAMGEGLAEANPVVGTTKPKDSTPRERTLSDAEIVALWRAAGEAGAFGKIVKLLILTGCRRMEICGLRWSEIDMDNGLLRLPPERTKNKRPHTLPLPRMALDIIATIPEVVARDHCFGERSDLGFTQWGAKRDLDARLGESVKPWTLHDLRRTAATGMADIGVQPHIIEATLNHISGHKVGVAGIYNRSSYEREVKAALALWSDHIRALVEGGGHKIVAYPQARKRLLEPPRA
jgi:integrase